MNNKNLKIIFFGTPDFVVPVLQALVEQFQVVAVVTAPDKKVGRKQVLTPSPVKEFSQGPCIFTPEKLDQELVEELKKLQPDLFVVAAYGKLLPSQVIEIPQYGSLNIHPSLLPKYRGPSPIQSAILNGDQVSGVSILVVDEKMDHGPVISTKEISISDIDTFDSLSKKLFEEGAKILVEIIPNFISRKIKPVEQNHQKATFTKMVTKEDGYFDINNPPSSEQLDKMIRAFYPWPNVWTKWNEKVVKFYPEGLVQMEGKKPIKLEDFLRGYPNFPIKKLL